MKSNLAFIVLLIITINVYTQTKSQLNDYYKQSVYHLNKTHQYDSAEYFANKGIELAVELDVKDTLAKFYRFKGVAFSRADKYEEAVEALNQAIEVNIELEDFKSQSKNINSIGATYYREGNTTKAIEYYQQALKLAKEIDYSNIISASLNNLGAAYKKTGDYIKATEYLIEALEIAQKSESKFNEAQALGNLAQCYAVAGNIDLSNKYYLQEKEIKEELNDYKGLINIYINMGVNYSSQMEKDSALIYYNKALIYAKQLDDKTLKAILYSNIAAIYNFQKKHESAIVLLKRAYKLNKELNRTKGLINTNINLAGNYKDIKQYKKAEYHFNEALDLVQTSNLKPEMLNLYNSMSEFYATTNNFLKAYEYKDLAYQLSDTLMNSEVAGKIEELQVKYETEKKEQQIIHLQNEKEIDKLQSQKKTRNFLIVLTLLASGIFGILLVARQNRVKANNKLANMNNRLLRSQMNPHFIFNSLNSVNSFILDNKPKEASSFLLRFSKLMRNILQSTRNDYTSLEQEIETLENYLNLEQLRFKETLTYNIEVSDDIDKEDIDIPPMLIQPFIENAIKHAFHDQKNNSINIRFLLDDLDALQCEIIDNGVGIENTLSKHKKKEHISYAMQITKERLEILNKKRKNNIIFKVVDLKTEGKQGTKVIFSIPI